MRIESNHRRWFLIMLAIVVISYLSTGYHPQTKDPAQNLKLEEKKIDYTQFPVPKLIVEAKVAGLKPRVNDSGALEIDSGDRAPELARALFAREMEVAKQINPDAFFRRALVGRWTQVDDPAGKSPYGIETFTFLSDGSGFHEIDDVVATLFMGKSKHTWVVTDGTIVTTMTGATGPLGQFSHLSPTQIIERYKICSIDSKNMRLNMNDVRYISLEKK